MHYEGSIRLTRMYTRCENYCSSHSDLFRFGSKICYNDHLTIISCDSLAQNRLSYFVFGVWSTYFLQILTAVTVGVWVTMRKVDFIIIVLKGYCKSQCEVESTSLLFHAILVIADVFPFSQPANT